MYSINPNTVPPVCLDKVTDWMAEPDASDIQTEVADFEVAAATIMTAGSIAYAKCRVTDCPVVCQIFHVANSEGRYQATGIASVDDETDLSNCVR